jgi:hypothetical protein
VNGSRPRTIADSKEHSGEEFVEGHHCQRLRGWRRLAREGEKPGGNYKRARLLPTTERSPLYDKRAQGKKV